MKKRVHYTVLEDMHKHLPVDVTAWIRANEPDENLIYAKGLGDQVCFVRDTLCQLLSSTYEEWHNNPPLVISTHYSKSVKLPVFQINLEKYGIEMVLRYNFYDWKISIKSDKPLDFDYMGLINPKQEIPYYCCEGFPRDKVYGSYGQSHSQFTIEIGSHYDLYTFFFLLKNYLGIKKLD